MIYFKLNSPKEKSVPKEYIPPAVSCWTALSTKDPDKAMNMIITFFEEKEMEVKKSKHDNFSFVTRSEKFFIAVSIYKRDKSFVVMFRRLSGDVVLYNDLFKEVFTHTGLELTTCIAKGSNYNI